MPACGPRAPGLKICMKMFMKFLYKNVNHDNMSGPYSGLIWGGLILAMQICKIISGVSHLFNKNAISFAVRSLTRWCALVLKVSVSYGC